MFVIILVGLVPTFIMSLLLNLKVELDPWIEGLIMSFTIIGYGIFCNLWTVKMFREGKNNMKRRFEQ